MGTRISKFCCMHIEMDEINYKKDAEIIKYFEIIRL